MANETLYGFFGFFIVELIFMVLTIFLAKSMWKRHIEEALEVAAQPVQPLVEEVVEKVVEPVIEEPEQETIVKEEPTELEMLRQRIKEAEKKEIEKKQAKEKKKEQKEKEQEPLYICPHKDCAKEFITEEKMRRHYGMSHYKDMNI